MPTRTLKPSRESFIPKGARRVTHKQSDAVAYVYESARGVPYAIAFHGRAQRPDWHFRFTSEERRAQRIAEHFEARAARLASRTARTAKRRQLEVGHILVASWGYDQTNIDFYQVTALVGETMVDVRPIAGNTIQGTGWMRGRSMPTLDAFTGPATRHRVQDGTTVKVRDWGVWARLWDGKPRDWSSDR